MPYGTFPYAGFGSLNLRDSPDVVEPTQAINAMNVLFVTGGSVGQRSGYAKFTAAEGTNRYDSLSEFYKADGTKQIIAGAGNRLEGLNSAGGIVASSAAPVANPHYFQRYGEPTAEHIYIANGVDQLRRWTGSAFETPAFVGNTPTGRFLGLSTTDNRLVNARYPGSAAGNNPSTVRFAAEGNPLSWGATHYVDLHPGDGEEIMGVATWRDLILVFKQTKFFAFYGNSVDDDGEPVFNYRPVHSRVGLVSSRALVTTEQGVYFLDRSGVHFTTGTTPERVSKLVEPIFKGAPSVYYTGGTLNDGSITNATLAYHDERLWLSFPGGSSSTNNRQLVFDPHEKWWSLTNLPAGPMVNFRVGNVEELLFGYAAGTKHLGRYVEGLYTADDMEVGGTDGNAIVSHWQGGWLNFGTAAVKTVREFKISGSGLVVITMYRDYRTAATWSLTSAMSPAGNLYDSGAAYNQSGVQYGPSTTIQAKPVRKSIRGEVFSLKLSNAVINRTFKINRFTAHIREARVPSVVKVA